MSQSIFKLPQINNSNSLRVYKFNFNPLFIQSFYKPTKDIEKS